MKKITECFFLPFSLPPYCQKRKMKNKFYTYELPKFTRILEIIVHFTAKTCCLRGQKVHIYFSEKERLLALAIKN